MKKLLLLAALAAGFAFSAASQTNMAVDLSDDVYEVLDLAMMRGACSRLMAAKPYTRKQVLKCIEEILESDVEMSDVEVSILKNYREKYTPKEDRKNSGIYARYTNGEDKTRMSFNYGLEFDTQMSGGIYNDSSCNSFGYDIIPTLKFNGDISKYFSYSINAFLDFSYMPLTKLGTYRIGYNWGDDNYTSKSQRTIYKYNNYSYLPFSYHRRWAGQFYYYSNMTASGLQGWAMENGFGFAINPDLRTSFIDDKVVIGFGRLNREIAGTDNGASLVLNANAQPFYALDMSFDLFPFLKYTFLTGITEYPNQGYIYPSHSDYCDSNYYDDAYYYQNAFSINMLELDFTHVHFDFGSTVIWPKRFELGYMFPLGNFVEYQNHIGDYDNLALFGTLKFTVSKKASFWIQGYLEEISGSVANPKKVLTWARAMYAAQLGYKQAITALPFGSFTFRYTRIEPYCYTHHSIKYTPWYNHYIQESYTSGGEGLGYYLPPNSDEFLVSVSARPTDILSVNVNYQLIRHGADYGSQQVPGSSYYSEMSPDNRDDLRKYFLHDGAYNWIHIISTGLKFNFNTRTPVEFTTNVGMVISYYTVINQSDYESDHDSTTHFTTGGSFKDSYHVENSDEYPFQVGAVLSAGVKIRL